MLLQGDMHMQATLHVLSPDQATTAHRLARSQATSCMQIHAEAAYRDVITDISAALAVQTDHIQQGGAIAVAHPEEQPKHTRQQPAAAAAHAAGPEDTTPMDEDVVVGHVQHVEDVSKHLVPQGVAEGTPAGTSFCETCNVQHVYNSARLHALAHR